MKRKNFAQLFLIILLALGVFGLSACIGVLSSVTVSFMVDGKEYANVSASEEVAPTLPENPEKECAVFDAWYYDDGIWEKPFTALSFFDLPLSDSMEVTLYAHFTENHTFGDWTTKTAATCTTAEVEHRTCSACGEEETRTGEAALGHSFGEWYVVTAATTTSTGVERRDCTRTGCSEYETREIPKLSTGTSLVIDHTDAQLDDLTAISESVLSDIKTELNIAYFHTSHGNQIVEGTTYIYTNVNTKYSLPADNVYDNYNEGGDGNYKDAGNSDVYTVSKYYLDAHTETNVMIWAWCGQLCWMSEQHVNDYLDDMEQLESEYPNVTFVYMTGHVFNQSYNLEGDGNSGTEARNTSNNAIIRNYCLTNGKILFDFEDMDKYDPDGNYYGDKHVNDNCDYDSDNNGSLDKNWAVDWQTANPTQWSNFYASHTQPINAISKGYAFWVLLSELAARIS